MTVSSTLRNMQCRSCKIFLPIKKYGTGRKICRQCRRINPTPKSFFTMCLNKTRHRKTPIAPDVHGEFLAELMKKQKGVCALSGKQMTLIHGQGVVGTNASIDRISHGAPYTRDNIRLVCLHANYMRRRMDDDELLDWCLAISRTITKTDDDKITTGKPHSLALGGQ